VRTVAGAALGATTGAAEGAAVGATDEAGWECCEPGADERGCTAGSCAVGEVEGDCAAKSWAVDADADGGADGGAAGDAAGAVVLASLLAMPLAPQAFLALPCYCQPAHGGGGLYGSGRG
jgi:hypothetical protein